MRAEIWKYIILYLNGGIFAEIDVFPLKPLQTWDLYPFETYQVIIGAFDNEYFSNKIFMSAPHHPLFKHIIESIYEKIKKFRNILKQGMSLIMMGTHILDRNFAFLNIDRVPYFSYF